MSFKVYGGLKIDGISTIEDAFKFIESTRKPIEECAEKKVAHDIKALACLIYDMFNCVGINVLKGDEDISNDESPLLAATTKIFQGNRSADSNETEYTLAIGSDGGVVVGISFFPDDNAEEVLFELPNVSEFRYWDNQDPIDGVSDEDWATRGEIWNNVLHGNAVPAETMFTIKLADTKYLVPRDEYMAEVPDLETRMRSLVMNIAYDKAYRMLEKDNANIPHDQFVRELQKIALKESVKLRKELTGKLTEGITISDLEKPLTTGEESET
jgi:hypothetical protein